MTGYADKVAGTFEAAELDRLCRAEWGQLLAVLIRDFRDFDLAEEALQAAFASALMTWTGEGPSNPRKLWRWMRWAPMKRTRRVPCRTSD